jgi:hypothetical protein
MHYNCLEFAYLSTGCEPQGVIPIPLAAPTQPKRAPKDQTVCHAFHVKLGKAFAGEAEPQYRLSALHTACTTIAQPHCLSDGTVDTLQNLSNPYFNSNTRTCLVNVSAKIHFGWRFCMPLDLATNA